MADEGPGVEVAEGIDFSKKHPLEHTWTLWFDNPNGRQKPTTFGKTLRPVYTFNTVEDFWCLYNNIVTPSKLVHGTDFHLFKEGIEPKWEDPKCARGGKWTFTVPKGNSRVPLDTYWLHVVLALIGEQFADPGEICGAVVNVRNRGDRISLWTRTGGNEAAQLSVGKQMKQVLDLNDSTKLGYMLHEDAMQQDRKAKDRYII